MVLLSARLSPTAIHHLLVKTGARALIVSPRLRHAAKQASSLFSVGETPPSVYSQKSYQLFLLSNGEYIAKGGTVCTAGHYIDESDRNVLILHSSGTTGLPKPIYTSHKYLLCFANCHNFETEGEARNLNLSTLPLFHVCFFPLCPRSIANMRAGIRTCHSRPFTRHREAFLSPAYIGRPDGCFHRRTIEGL